MRFQVTLSETKVSLGHLFPQLMAPLIEEGDDISQRLLDTVLENVLSPRKDENPAAFK